LQVGEELNRFIEDSRSVVVGELAIMTKLLEMVQSAKDEMKGPGMYSFGELKVTL
jgi:hypothetical protein